MKDILFFAIAIALTWWSREWTVKRPIRGKGTRYLVSVFLLLFVFANMPDIVAFLGRSVHVTVKETIVFIAMGLLLSIPIIVTGNFEIRDDHRIYHKKNIAFVIVLILLFLFKELLKDYTSGINKVTLTLLVTWMGMAYLLPFRFANFIKIRRLYKQLQHQKSLYEKKSEQDACADESVDSH